MPDRANILLPLAALAVTFLLTSSCERSLIAQMAGVEESTASEGARVSSRPLGLVILDSTAPQASDSTVEKTMLYYGLGVRKLDVSKSEFAPAQVNEEAGFPYRAIAINYRTLEKLSASGDGVVEALRAVASSGANLLVSGISANDNGTESVGLMGLTDNKVRGARQPVDAHRDWRVGSGFTDATLELTGVVASYPAQPQEDFALLVPEDGTDVVPLITSTDDSGTVYTVFARYPLGYGGVFLDSNLSGNLDQSRMIDLYNSRYFGRLAPAMMFVRYAFGDMAWHSNRRFANLTVDDPALKEPWYSFSYRQMLPHMKNNDFHVTVSMPPASYSEAQKEALDIVLGNPDRFSVAVHGNNHDGYEFYKYSTEPKDPEPARPLEVQEADLVEALTRMEELKMATGVPYGRVMIFPYNISPLGTIALLKKYNYAATANAGNVPLDELPKAAYDFNMYPAVMDYGAFPLLTRYEPDELPYPMLFFAGKPALPFAHVDFFREKPEAFDGLAQDINKSWGKTRVEWRSLDDIVKRLYLEKANEEGSRDVKFFTSQLVLTNDSDQSRTYNLQKAEGLEAPIARVEVDGKEAPYAVKDGLLTLALAIQSRSEARVAITYGGPSLPDLALAPNGISYEQASGTLEVQVENKGAQPAPVPLAVYDGSNGTPVSITTLPPLAPGQKATGQVDVSKLPVKGDFTVRINPFGIVEEARWDNNDGLLTAPEAGRFVVDNFEYDDPGKHGWSVQKGEGIGSLRAVYDTAAASRVLEMSSPSPEPQDFKVNYPLPGNSLSILKRFLSVKLKSTSDFEIFVKVTGVDGNPYYLQYTSKAGSPTTYQNYLIYPLGAGIKDGAWHALDRDLDADMRGLFRKVDYFVVTGSVRLDDLMLSSEKARP